MASTASTIEIVRRIGMSIHYCSTTKWHDVHITLDDAIKAELGPAGVQTVIFRMTAIAKDQVARKGKYRMLSIHFHNVTRDEMNAVKDDVIVLSLGQYFAAGYTADESDIVFHYANDLALLRSIAPGAQLKRE